jgi:hypothetical protein
MDFTGINFMGTAVGILAFDLRACAAVRQERHSQILGWGIATIAAGWAAIFLYAWAESHNLF